MRDFFFGVITGIISIRFSCSRPLRCVADRRTRFVLHIMCGWHFRCRGLYTDLVGSISSLSPVHLPLGRNLILSRPPRLVALCARSSSFGGPGPPPLSPLTLIRAYCLASSLPLQAWSPSCGGFVRFTRVPLPAGALFPRMQPSLQCSLLLVAGIEVASVGSLTAVSSSRFVVGAFFCLSSPSILFGFLVPAPVSGPRSLTVLLCRHRPPSSPFFSRLASTSAPCSGVYLFGVWHSFSLALVIVCLSVAPFPCVPRRLLVLARCNTSSWPARHLLMLSPLFPGLICGPGGHLFRCSSLGV